MRKVLVGAVVTLALIVSGCGRDNKKEAESRIKKLNLLTLETMDKNHNAYPDMSSSEAAKVALVPALATDKDTGADDHNGWSDDVFTEPVSDKPFVPNASLSSVPEKKIDDPGTMITFYAPEPVGDERLVVFADGHVEWVKENYWSIKKLQSGIK